MTDTIELHPDCLDQDISIMYEFNTIFFIVWGSPSCRPAIRIATIHGFHLILAASLTPKEYPGELLELLKSKFKDINHLNISRNKRNESINWITSKSEHLHWDWEYENG